MNDAEKTLGSGAGTASGQAWIGFTLAGQHYLAPVGQVQEIVVPDEITPVPGAPDAVLGIMNLRSRLLVVLDGCKRLRLAPAAGAAERRRSQRVLVLDAGDDPVGLLVESIGDLAVLDEGLIDKPPWNRNSGPNGPVRGVIRREGGFTAVVDFARLCDPEPLAGADDDGGRNDL